MSSLDRRTLIRLGLASGVSLALAACFRPMYGPTASGGNLADVLASIEIGPLGVPVDLEEFAHELRNELRFLLNGSGTDAARRYKLELRYNQQMSTPIIDPETGRALTSSITGTVEYTLRDTREGKNTDSKNAVVAQGQVTALVTYERPQQRFASLRARRDAYRRLGKTLAGHIRNRLATALSAK